MKYIHLPSQQVFKPLELTKLTERDLWIITSVKRGMEAGHLQQQISEALGYAFPSALRQQMQRLRERFDVTTNAQLINKLIEMKVIRGPKVSEPALIRRRPSKGVGRTPLNHPFRQALGVQRVSVDARNREAATGSQQWRNK